MPRGHAGAGDRAACLQRALAASLRLDPVQAVAAKRVCPPHASLPRLACAPTQHRTPQPAPHPPHRCRSEFVFVNPNAKGTCGCGESFTVDPKAARQNAADVQQVAAAGGQ